MANPLERAEALSLMAVHIDLAVASGGAGTLASPYGRDYNEVEGSHLHVVQGEIFGDKRWGGISPVSTIERYAILGMQQWPSRPEGYRPFRLRGDYRPATWTQFSGDVWFADVTAYIAGLIAKYPDAGTTYPPDLVCCLHDPDAAIALLDSAQGPMRYLAGTPLDIVHPRVQSARIDHDTSDSPDTPLVDAIAAVTGTGECFLALDANDGTYRVFLDYADHPGESPNDNGTTVLGADSWADESPYSRNEPAHGLTNPNPYCQRMHVAGVQLAFAGHGDGDARGSRYVNITLNANVADASVTLENVCSVLNSGGDGIAMIQNTSGNSAWRTKGIMVYRGASELGPIGTASNSGTSYINWRDRYSLHWPEMPVRSSAGDDLELDYFGDSGMSPHKDTKSTVDFQWCRYGGESQLETGEVPDSDPDNANAPPQESWWAGRSIIQDCIGDGWRFRDSALLAKALIRRTKFIVSGDHALGLSNCLLQDVMVIKRDANSASYKPCVDLFGAGARIYLDHVAIVIFAENTTAPDANGVPVIRVNASSNTQRVFMRNLLIEGRAGHRIQPFSGTFTNAIYLGWDGELQDSGPGSGQGLFDLALTSDDPASTSQSDFWLRSALNSSGGGGSETVEGWLAKFDAGNSAIVLHAAPMLGTATLEEMAAEGWEPPADGRWASVRPGAAVLRTALGPAIATGRNRTEARYGPFGDGGAVDLDPSPVPGGRGLVRSGVRGRSRLARV